MELRHIRYFLAVAAEKNFTRAAERVGIGQPPLSLQIRDMEREIGAPLFHRVPQGAELTAAGKAFHELVRHIPAQVERAAHAAQRAMRGEVGTLSVGFTVSSAFNPVVAAAIRNFRRAYPDVILRLKESNTPRLISGLQKGALDVVFMRPGEVEDDGLILRTISEEPLLAVVPSKHSAAKRTKLKLADLREENLILFPRQISPKLFDTIMAACRKAGFEPRLGQSVPQITSIVQLVAAELGVSLVPASMQQLQVKGAVFKEVHDVSATASLTLAWRRSDPSPFLKNFIASTLES
jgi:DNA-binding transcriptional LysR family regulator